MLAQATGGETVPEVDPDHIGTERRRSERVQVSLPLIIRGIDLLGQPFEERSSTIVFSLHGCRYSSKYHLPKNTWVTLELAKGAKGPIMRARVAWIQRPHSVREQFQIAAELESPGNIWDLDPAPAEWADAGASAKLTDTSPVPSASQDELLPETSGVGAAPATLAKFLEGLNSGDPNPLAASLERTSSQPPESPREIAAPSEEAVPGWRERLDREMELAQAQWNELLQSSLDSTIRRLAERLSEQSQEALRNTEEAISARIAVLRGPLAEASAEARDALMAVKSGLNEEVDGARAALAEIEQSALRTKDYSAQLEAASHDTLNELHRRIENILETQTKEMTRRAEALAAEASERIASTLDSLAHQVSERALADLESKLAPRIARVSELLGEISAREAQADEGLRLHRERLRQIFESNRRDVNAQVAERLASLHEDFESAREKVLIKWMDDLESAGAHASHDAAEAISRASEWFQKEARARLQVHAEQTLAAAGGSLEERTAEAESKFTVQLDEHSSAHLAEIRQRLDGVASELADRTRTQIAEAAEAAAATFGQVIGGISEREVRQFTGASRIALGRALRDSCAMIFGSLAEALTEPPAEPGASASGVVEFAPALGREAADVPPPRNDSAPSQLSA